MTIHHGTRYLTTAPSLSFTVAPGQIWRHHGGALYVVLALVLDEAALTWRVHYQRRGGGPFWCRSLAEWVGMVDYEGAIIPRYTLLRENVDCDARSS